jgi:hypothetical protein
MQSISVTIIQPCQRQSHTPTTVQGSIQPQPCIADAKRLHVQRQSQESSRHQGRVETPATDAHTPHVGSSSSCCRDCSCLCHAASSKLSLCSALSTHTCITQCTHVNLSSFTALYTIKPSVPACSWRAVVFTNSPVDGPGQLLLLLLRRIYRGPLAALPAVYHGRSLSSTLRS